LSGTAQVGRYQKKPSPTHTHPDHQTSFINFLHLLQSTASSLFNLRDWQSFSTTSLQILFGLPLGLFNNVMKICPQFFSIILLTNTGQNTDYKRQIRRAKMKYFSTNIMSWPMLIKHIPKTMPCNSMHYTLRAHIYTCGRTFTDMQERFWLNAFQGDSYGKSSHVSVILYCFQRYCNHFKKNTIHHYS